MTAEVEPTAELDAGFSSKNAVAAQWSQARSGLQDAPLYWLTTVRQDGRPHVTPVLGVWLDGAMHFCTGPDERKAKNLTDNQHCIVTTGRGDLEDGIDLVLEGTAEAVSGAAELGRIADTYESKYGARITDPDGTWFGLSDAIRAGDTLLFRVAPTVAFGFGKGKEFSQTRWTFAVPG